MSAAVYSADKAPYLDPCLQPQLAYIDLPFDAQQSRKSWSVQWTKLVANIPFSAAENLPRRRRTLSNVSNAGAGNSAAVADQELECLLRAQARILLQNDTRSASSPSILFDLPPTFTLLEADHLEGSRSLWIFNTQENSNTSLEESPDATGQQARSDAPYYLLNSISVIGRGSFDYAALFPDLSTTQSDTPLLANETPSLSHMKAGGIDGEIVRAFQYFTRAVQQAIVQHLSLSPNIHKDLIRRPCGDALLFSAPSNPAFQPILYLPAVSIRKEGLIVTAVWRSSSYDILSHSDTALALRLSPINVEASYIRPFAITKPTFTWSDDIRKPEKVNGRKEEAEIPRLASQFCSLFPFVEEREAREWIVCRIVIGEEEKEVLWPKAYCLQKL